MSKNIVIAEGRRGRRFGAVKKLRTKLQGGGDCLWVPEDDVQLESLYAYENGVYRPEKYGFDSASVSVVDASLTPLNTVHNTPYFPPGNTDGFSQVTVNVPASEQDTYMDAVQLQCLSTPADKPYLAVLMSEWEEPDGNRTRGVTYFQSAFPFYVRWIKISNIETPQPNLYTFVRGQNSVRAIMNWDNYKGNGSGDPDALPHAYLHNCIVDCSDTFSGNSGSIGSGIESYIENGEDKIRWGSSSYSSYATIVEEGDHLGASRIVAGTVGLLKQSSTIPSAQDIPSSGYVGTWMRTIALVHCINNRYSNNYLSGVYGDYRVIKTKAFSSMEEWLTWCKTH